MRAFVTGASGFVGPWLCRHLEASGDEVVPAGHDRDVTDADSIAEALIASRPDAVYHLAAQSSVGSSWADATGTFRVNVFGTLHVLDAANACPSRPRVLVVSSAEVYGEVSPLALPVAETAPFRPGTPYAASKAAAELAGLQAFLGRGLEVVRARPFNHTGPGQGPGFVVPALARQVVEASLTGATVLKTGNLTARRDFTDVRDVVAAYRLLIERGSAGESTTCAAAGQCFSWIWLSGCSVSRGRTSASRWRRSGSALSTFRRCEGIPAGWKTSPDGVRRSTSTGRFGTCSTTGVRRCSVASGLDQVLQLFGELMAPDLQLVEADDAEPDGDVGRILQVFQRSHHWPR